VPRTDASAGERIAPLRQFTLFALVGGAGFVVDAGMFLLLVQVLGANIYPARVASWLIAATFTWRLNRTLTFGNADRRGLWRQWLRFLAANLGGGLVNLALSALLIGPVGVAPVLAIACGSIAGLLWNFLASRKFVFVAPDTTAQR
jgi:putative flippase GtrA